jgi:hypothetical protein
MAFVVQGSHVKLEGPCPVEEAPDLFQALLAIETPVFDVGGAVFVHTAIVQLLIASRGRLVARPEDPTLAACLEGVETVDRSDFARG